MIRCLRHVRRYLSLERPLLGACVRGHGSANHAHDSPFRRVRPLISRDLLAGVPKGVVPNLNGS
jgi:hypothetical protein